MLQVCLHLNKSLDNIHSDIIEKRSRCLQVLNDIKNDINNEFSSIIKIHNPQILNFDESPLNLNIVNIFKILTTEIKPLQFIITTNESSDKYYITRTDSPHVPFANITIYKNDIKIKAIEDEALYTVHEKKIDTFVEYLKTK